MSEKAFVLIVEKQADNGDNIAEGLGRSGYICKVVESGGDALASIRQRPPDVVIADYRLSDRGRPFRLCNGQHEGLRVHGRPSYVGRRTQARVRPDTCTGGGGLYYPLPVPGSGI